MEENKQILELMQKMEKSARQQVRLGRILCALLLVLVVCCGALLATVSSLLPQMETALMQFTQVMGQMEGLMVDLETVAATLAQADLGSMVENVDALVQTAQQSLALTMEKLNTIDFATLNQAIADLAAVVEPLAKIPSLFR